MRSHFPLKAGVIVAACVSMAGCAQRQQTYVSQGPQIDPRYGVSPSPRVVADGEPVPKGGGHYIVGAPYKIAGKTYYPSEHAYAAVGTASWYGSDFHGRKTANGEVFDRDSISAAHPTMPLPSYARVTNLRNSHSIIVRVNDRGPYHGGRVMDVSQRVAEALDFKRYGTARVKVEYVGRAQPEGSDDSKLMASLRTDGSPAALEGVGNNMSNVMLADREPEKPRLAALHSVDSKVDASDDDDSSPADKVESHQAKAPLPPVRPFDLGPSSHANSSAGRSHVAAVSNAVGKKAARDADRDAE